MADHPSDPRSTDAYDGVESMTAQAKANGINGFVVSWDGDDENGGNDQGHAQQFQLALRAADADGQVVTGYLESGEAARTGTVGMTELRWLHQLLTYSSDPAFLKDSRGIPVVFVFEMAELSPAQWGAIMSTLASKYGESVDLVGDTTDPAYAHLEGGFARYYTTGGMRGLREYDVHTAVQAKAGAVVDHAVDPKLFVGTVSPGFDDRCKRPDQNDPVLSRDDGARYTDTWRAALSAQPDWILVTSWNEWYEDTEVEPGQNTGDQALQQTADESARWQDRPPPTTSPTATTATTATTSPTGTSTSPSAATSSPASAPALVSGVLSAVTGSPNCPAGSPTPTPTSSSPAPSGSSSVPTSSSPSAG